MDLEDNTLNSEKKTNTIWFHLYTESKKYMNEHNNNKHKTDSHNNREQTSGYQWAKGKGDGQDRIKGIKKYTFIVYKINKLQGYTVQQGGNIDNIL